MTPERMRQEAQVARARVGQLPGEAGFWPAEVSRWTIAAELAARQDRTNELLERLLLQDSGKIVASSGGRVILGDCAVELEKVRDERDRYRKALEEIKWRVATSSSLGLPDPGLMAREVEERAAEALKPREEEG